MFVPNLEEKKIFVVMFALF